MARIDALICRMDSQGLAETLMESGKAHVETVSEEFFEGSGLDRASPCEDLDEVKSLIASAEKILEDLPDTRGGRGALDDLLDIPLRVVRTMGSGDAGGVQKARALIREIEPEVEGIAREKASITQRRQEIRGEQDRLRPLDAPDFDAGLVGEGEFTKTVFGLVDADKKAFVEGLQRLGDLAAQRFKAKNGDAVAITFHKSIEKDVMEILKESRFKSIDVKEEGNLKAYVAGLKKEEGECFRRLKCLEEKLEKISEKHQVSLLNAYETLYNERRRIELAGTGGSTEKVAYMRLWTPRRDCPEVVSIIRKASPGCVVETDMDPEDAPTLIENPKYLSSFEMLTRLFSLPRYNQIDPTLIIAPSFVLFFGLMLTDFVYGAFLSVVSYLLYKRYNEKSKAVGDLMIIMFSCGLAAMFFGVLTGSFFGDFVGKYLLDGEPQDIALWLDPLHGNNSIIWLGTVCAAGFLHVYLGYMVGAVDSLRRRRYREALTRYLSWYVFAGGMAVTILSSYPAQATILPASLYPVGVAATFTGLALLYMGMGLMFLLDIVGVVGNSLSYARLIALGLTTAGIALATNLLAQIALDVPAVGVFLAAFVFLAGHLINILMNTLGAFVHSLRLQYVEFFGSFYEGGGRKFEPFIYEKIYT